MKRVDPKEAKALMDEGWTYVDVRSEPEFEQGHPAGAVNVPLLHPGQGSMVPNLDFLMVMKAAFPTDARLVVGCNSAARSTRAATLLEGQGYTQLVIQRAGFGGARDASGQVVEPGWAEAQLPVGTGQPEGRAY